MAGMWSSVRVLLWKNWRVKQRESRLNRGRSGSRWLYPALLTDIVLPLGLLLLLIQKLCEYNAQLVTPNGLDNLMGMRATQEQQKGFLQTQRALMTQDDDVTDLATAPEVKLEFATLLLAALPLLLRKSNQSLAVLQRHESQLFLQYLDNQYPAAEELGISSYAEMTKLVPLNQSATNEEADQLLLEFPKHSGLHIYAGLDVRRTTSQSEDEVSHPLELLALFFQKRIRDPSEEAADDQLTTFFAKELLFNSSIPMRFPNVVPFQMAMNMFIRHNLSVVSDIASEFTLPSPDIVCHTVDKMLEVAGLRWSDFPTKSPLGHSFEGCKIAMGKGGLSNELRRFVWNLVVHAASEDELNNLHVAALPSRPATTVAGPLESNIVFYMAYLFLWPYARLVRDVVSEKEKQLKEYLMIMGLPAMSLLVSWFLLYFLASGVVSLIAMWMLSGTMFAATTMGNWYFFMLMMAFITSMLLFGVAITPMFSQTRTAAACAPLLYMLLSAGTFIRSLVGGDLIASSESLALTIDVLDAISSPVVFMASLHDVLAFDAVTTAHRPVTWSTVAKPCRMMALQSAGYLLLGWYLENVFPRTYGVQQKWYFVFQPSFWFPKATNSAFSDDDDNNESVRLTEMNPDNFDERMDDTLREQPLREYLQHFQPSLFVQSLSKTYPNGKEALKNVSFGVRKGEIFGLLGPNGAGKSTTLSILCGMLSPSSGDAYVGGSISVASNPQTVRQSLSVCFQQNILFDDLTVWEHLSLFGVGYKLTVVHQEDLGQDDEEDPHLGGVRRQAWADKLMTTLKKYVPNAAIVSDNKWETRVQLNDGEERQFAELFKELEQMKQAGVIKRYAIAATDLEDVFVKVTEGEDVYYHAKDDVENADATVSVDALRSNKDDEKAKAKMQWQPTGIDRKLPEWQHSISQLRALIIKRMKMSSRDKKALFAQYVWPLAFFAIIMAVLQHMASSSGSIETVTTLQPVAEGTSFFVSSASEVTDSVAAIVAQIEKSSHPIVFDKSATTEQEMLDAIARDNTSTYFGGIFVSDVSWTDNTLSSPGMAYSLYYNETVRRSLPVTLQWVSQAYCKARSIQENTPEIDTCDLVAKRGVFPIEINIGGDDEITPDEDGDMLVDPDDAVNVVRRVMMAFYLLVTLSSIVSFYITPPVKEKENGLKRLQFQHIESSNASFIYWLSNFMFDFTAYILAITIMIIILAVFSSSLTGEILLAWLISLVLFGLTVIPFLYLCSLAFASHSSAQSIMSYVSMFQIMAASIGFALSMVPGLCVKMNTIAYFLQLLPLYTFGITVLDIVTVSWAPMRRQCLEYSDSLDTMNPFAMLEGMDTHASVWDWDVSGSNWFSLAASAMLYTLLLLVLDQYQMFPTVIEHKMRYSLRRIQRWLPCWRSFGQGYTEADQTGTTFDEESPNVDMVRAIRVSKVFNPRKKTAGEGAAGDNSEEAAAVLNESGQVVALNDVSFSVEKRDLVLFKGKVVWSGSIPDLKQRVSRGISISVRLDSAAIWDPEQLQFYTEQIRRSVKSRPPTNTRREALEKSCLPLQELEDTWELCHGLLYHNGDAATSAVSRQHSKTWLAGLRSRFESDDNAPTGSSVPVEEKVQSSIPIVEFVQEWLVQEEFARLETQLFKNEITSRSGEPVTSADLETARGSGSNTSGVYETSCTDKFGLAEAFALMEENKSRFNISHYSISELSLERVFEQFT
ncbi:hypothetical protein PRIC1_015047 [Phytophthora ramorum]